MDNEQSKIKIEWHNGKRKLSQLIPWARNPRKIDKESAKRLAQSLEKFSQVETIAIGPGNELYNGHQRLKVWGEKFGDIEIDVRISNRPLNETEREELTMNLHKSTLGEWDWEVMREEFDPTTLQSGGFTEDELIDGGMDLHIEPELYTCNIQGPIYTPQGEKPAVSELYDLSKTNLLLEEIEAADIPEDEKEFLRIAARRHTVLNYKNIAEYYAHAPANIQRLMENSALVIIDFNRAIELGYVRLSEEIAAQYTEDYKNDGAD